MSEHFTCDEHAVLAGDARFVLPDSFVADVMVCDPPYRAHVHKNATSQDQHTDGNVRHNDFGFVSLTEELRTWICQLAARTRRWILIYTDVESVAKWKDTLELAGATYIRTLPWVRWSMPALSGDRPPQGFECIVVAYGSNRGRKRWNGAGNLVRLAHSLDWSGPDELLDHLADSDDLTHLEHLALRGKDKFKTEKPLDQLLDLVSWFSDRDELVVDPCSGSGTTGLACKILRRRFIGCELDAEWAKKGNARIQACNVDNLPGSLSPRDSERFLRWVTTSEKERIDSVERKFNTERVRKRMADKKLALGDSSGGLLLVPIPSDESNKRAGCDHMAGENKELCVICGGFMLPVAATLAQVAAQNPDALPLAAQLLGVPACPSCGFVMRSGHVCPTKPKEKIMNQVPAVWTQAYERCLAEPAATPPAVHCGSTSCLLRPLQTDERETACGCGCPSCSELSKHMRPPSGGGRTDGAGAPEPAAPPAAIVRPPLTSAAERTVSLFDPPFEDEYTAKKWREAYERCLWELAPPLSPTLRARLAEKKAMNGSVITCPCKGCEACARNPVTGTFKPTSCSRVSSLNGASCAECFDYFVKDHGMAGRSVAKSSEPVRAMPNRPDAAIQALTGDGAKSRCPLCIDESVQCDACRDFATKNEPALPAWATAKVPYTGRLAPGEAIPNPRMFMKDDVPVPVSATGSCAACERGDERPFTHNCEKGGQQAPPPAAAAAARGGRGRPPGSKNKAPKPWKTAYTRVMAELGAS